jgi:hypothetical protein
MELKDLPPKHDPKGGSPKTPYPMPVSEYYQYTNGGTIWRMATSMLAGLVIGLLVAWWTATQSKGVTEAQMERFVQDYSPYAKDKELLASHNSIQDQQIGELRGSEDKIMTRLSTLDFKVSSDEKDIVDIRNKIDLTANFIEELKKPKR